MIVNIKPLIRGILSYMIPSDLIPRKGTGGSNSAEYCYSVWLRHLVQLKNCGLINNMKDIKRVAELGPGDSLGIGIAALYSGAKAYYALDVIEHSNVSVNKLISESIYELFYKKSQIPNGAEYVEVNPVLEDYSYPKEILEVVHREIREEIELALTHNSKKIKIEYVVPWDSNTDIKNDSIELIFSQAVMEHVSDIKTAYKKMHHWLRPGGMISHQIDFKAHEISEYWTGHWYISNWMWRVLMHGRKYIINRTTFSDHIKAIKAAGFQIKNVVPVIKENPLRTMGHSHYKKNSSENDFKTSSCLIQAVK